MSELFFVVKTFIFSVIVVFLMQIKIGQSTIEQRSMKWIQQSDVVESLQAVAEGAVLAARQGAKTVSDLANGKIGSSEKKTAHSSSSGGSWFKIKHKRGQSEKSEKDEAVEDPTGDEID
jgi:hypothetical protein